MERARPRCWGGFVTPASPRSPRTSGGLAACPCLSADGTAPPPPSPPPDPGKAGWGFMLRQGLHSHQSRLPPGTSRGLWPCVHSPGLGEIPASQSRERWVGVQTRSGSWFPPVVCPSHQARVPPTNHVSLLSIVSRLICPAHRSRVPPSSCFSHQSRVPAPIACPLPPITSPYYQSHLPSSKRISFPPIACVAPPRPRIACPAHQSRLSPIACPAHQPPVPPTNGISLAAGFTRRPRCRQWT